MEGKGDLLGARLGVESNRITGRLTFDLYASDCNGYHFSLGFEKFLHHRIPNLNKNASLNMHVFGLK